MLSQHIMITKAVISTCKPMSAMHSNCMTLNFWPQGQCMLRNEGLQYIQGVPIKNNPLGKINYLSYCKIFHQIYSFYTGGFRPHKQ